MCHKIQNCHLNIIYTSQFNILMASFLELFLKLVIRMLIFFLKMSLVFSMSISWIRVCRLGIFIEGFKRLWGNNRESVNPQTVCVILYWVGQNLLGNSTYTYVNL